MVNISVYIGEGCVNVCVVADGYLVFSSSLTRAVTIPDLLICGCISVRLESMHSIREVSHCASYLFPNAMCLIGRSVAAT